MILKGYPSQKLLNKIWCDPTPHSRHPPVVHANIHGGSLAPILGAEQISRAPVAPGEGNSCRHPATGRGVLGTLRKTSELQIQSGCFLANLQGFITRLTKWMFVYVAIMLRVFFLYTGMSMVLSKWIITPS